MFLLLLSFVSLWAGPLVFVWIERWLLPKLFLETFAVVFLLGLLCLHVLPESIAHGGFWALLFAALGIIIPYLIDLLGYCGKVSHPLQLIGVIAMGLHAFFDGVGLAGDQAMVTAVATHRFMEGMGLWCLLRPQYGATFMMVIYTILSGITFAGSLVAQKWLSSGVASTVHVIQAAIAGSLLHILIHPHHTGNCRSIETALRVRLGIALLGMLAAGMVLAYVDLHTCHHHLEHSSGSVGYFLLIAACLQRLWALYQQRTCFG